MSKTRFSVDCPGAKSVFLAGDFNDWDPTARRMKRVRKGGSEFAAVVELEPGRYQFKYIVDGDWCCCPHSPRERSAEGIENSVLEVEA